MLCVICCCVHVRSPVGESSKKSALKLGTVEAKTKAKQHAKLDQERRPCTDDTPSPLAREQSNVAVSSQPLAAPPGEIDFEKLPEKAKANTEIFFTSSCKKKSRKNFHRSLTSTAVKEQPTRENNFGNHGFP